MYIDFLSLFKSNTKITKINLIFNEIDIIQLRELSSIIKPSNFKTLINNKVKQGNLISEVDVFLNEDGSLKNFIARGTVKALRAELSKNLNLNIESLNFFSDKSDILIKNIFGNIDKIQILEGNIKLNLENGVEVSSNFDSKFDIDEKFFIKYSKLINNYKFLNLIKELKGKFSNNLNLVFDNTFKLENYNYTILGKVEKSNFELNEAIENSFIKEKIKKFIFLTLN